MSRKSNKEAHGLERSLHFGSLSAFVSTLAFAPGR